MAKESEKIYNETSGRITAEQLDAVSGGTVSEEEYAVTTEKKCPYCGGTQVYRASMMKNIGFTKIWREYKCRKCGDCFWYEEYC